MSQPDQGESLTARLRESMRNVLFDMVVSPERISEVRHRLQPEMFITGPERRILDSTLDIFDKTGTVDPAMVHVELDEDTGKALAYLIEGDYPRPTTKNVAAHVAQLEELHWRREAGRLIEDAGTAAKNGCTNIEFAAKLTAIGAHAPPTAQAGPEPFDMAQVLTDRPPDPAYIIPALKLVRGERAVLGGRGKLGKSFALADLALALTTATPWLGMTIPEPVRVLYIDAEQPRDLAWDRLQRLGRGRKITADDIGDRLCYVRNKRVNLAVPAARDWLRRTIDTHQADVLLVDSLKRLSRVDENASQEMGGFLDDILGPILDETGVASVILHHLRKGNIETVAAVLDALRGSGDIGAWFDTVWGYIDRGGKRIFGIAAGRRGTMPEIGVTLREPKGDTGPASLVPDDVESGHVGTVRCALGIAGSAGLPRQKAIEAITAANHGIGSDVATKAADRSLRSLFDGGEASKLMVNRERVYYRADQAPEGSDHVTSAGSK